MQVSGSMSAVVSELDELVDSLTMSRSRQAAAFATEMFFFARVAGIVARREAERATRDGRDALSHSTQLGMREVYAELAAALQLSEWQVARKVSLAWTLSDRFQETLYEAGDGRLSPAHATLIADAGIEIDDPAVRAEFEAVALDMAREMTPAQFKAALAGLVVRLDPEGTEKRVREAVHRRKVTVRALEPGLVRVTADVPTAQGVGAVERIRQIATELFTQNQAEKTEWETNQATGTAAASGDGSDHGAGGDAAGGDGDGQAGRASSDAHGRDDAHSRDETHGSGDGSIDADSARAESDAHASDEPTDGDGDDPGDGTPVFDERTIPQIMADVFNDLLLTGALHGHGNTEQTHETPTDIHATVNVTIPVTTLAGVTVGGATLDGFGPIDDTTARHLATTTPEWQRVATDPATGVPTCVDRYRPTERQKQFLRTRDQHCRFPGCRRPARKCDIDHTIPYAEGGPTCLCNLEHFCERHHTLKHHTDWTVTQLTGGILHFTAPTGRTHTTRPPGTVRFTPTALINPDPHTTHHLQTQNTHDPAPF